jgi:hypothetical protein
VRAFILIILSQKCTQTLHAEANIQLDAEKLDINPPVPAPATTTSEIHTLELSSAIQDFEMGEPAILNAEHKNVSRLIVYDQTERSLL